MAKREEVVWNAGLQAEIRPDLVGRILEAASDVSAVLEGDGTVRSIVTSQGARSLGCLDHWIGRDFRDFVTNECRPKVDAMLEALREAPDQPPRRVQINHVDNATWEFPIDYAACALGAGGQVLLVGRDLRPIAEIQQKLVQAQRALERDYEVHREFDTRYRVVIAASRDAFVFVDAVSGRIEDVNAVAAALLDADAEVLNGAPFFQEFEDRRRAEFLDALNAHASSKSEDPLVVTARRTGATVRVFPKVFRAAGRLTLLCRLENDARVGVPMEALGRNLLALYLRGHDAVVITDDRGVIRAANESFLSLCDVVDEAAVRGRSLGEFMARGELDLRLLVDSGARRARPSAFATRLQTSFGAPRPVGIAVTRLGDAGDSALGFVLRDETGREARAPDDTPGEVPRSVSELVGASPLKDIVAATTDVIERICIETAVKMTRNNRVAAAEMLGLSRQSLYVKLRKYDLIDRADVD